MLSIANQFYDFNPANAQAGKINAYDLATGNIVGSWNLPSGCVGNSIDIDDTGNYYVGDIEPDTRIIKIDPNTNEVTTWANDSQWRDGDFGTGGMVWNKSDGFYVAHAGVLWYIPQNSDGTAGTAMAVNLTGTIAVDGSNLVNADGMTWAGGNTIFYAENDVFTPGWNGIVHRVELSDATNGTNTNYIESINDCSGVFFSNNTLYVNESQFGVAFGVNFVPTSNPFCVKTYEVNDIPTSIFDVIKNNADVSIFPNPSLGEIQIESKKGQLLEKVEIYSLDGKLINSYSLSSNTATLKLEHFKDGLFFLNVILENGEQMNAKLIIKN